MFKALIFDLDGVLVNTMPLHFKAWEELATAHERPFDQAMKDSFRGLHQTECVKSLFASETLSTADTLALLKQKNNHYQSVIRNTAPHNLLAEGAVELLQNARKEDLRLGIASSSVSARVVVQHTGLMDYVDAVADGHCVKNGKPATDIFVWVAGALQTRPTDCLVFEDGAVGIQAANKAGMTTVGIGTGAWLDQANFRYERLQDFQLHTIQQQASHHHTEERV